MGKFYIKIGLIMNIIWNKGCDLPKVTISHKTTANDHTSHLGACWGLDKASGATQRLES